MTIVSYNFMFRKKFTFGTNALVLIFVTYTSRSSSAWIRNAIVNFQLTIPSTPPRRAHAFETSYLNPKQNEDVKSKCVETISGLLAFQLV